LGKWEGIVDVELKIDPRDGKPKFIEVNPRPWGSIYGAFAAGVDFPYLWMKVGLREDFDQIDEFEEEIYASFLTRDLLLLADVVEKLFTNERSEVWEVLKTYARPYFWKHKNAGVNATSDFVLGDLRPFIKNLSRVKGGLVPKFRAR
jgi:predicted ATP-grasp superfamily ATP-dependent carboligase